MTCIDPVKQDTVVQRQELPPQEEVEPLKDSDQSKTPSRLTASPTNPPLIQRRDPALRAISTEEKEQVSNITDNISNENSHINHYRDEDIQTSFAEAVQRPQSTPEWGDDRGQQHLSRLGDSAVFPIYIYDTGTLGYIYNISFLHILNNLIPLFKALHIIKVYDPGKYNTYIFASISFVFNSTIKIAWL